MCIQLFLSIAITNSHTIAIVYVHSITLCTLSLEWTIISEVYNISLITIPSTLSNLHRSSFNWACKLFIFNKNLNHNIYNIGHKALTTLSLYCKIFNDMKSYLSYFVQNTLKPRQLPSILEAHVAKRPRIA